ncbi:MAG: hydrogenase expression/formation protein HypE [Candidatus Marinimicrobia bacterium]|nr:hydrogenase expression/formation protein HypE [Candidatus Neomarinimicrobiota bacterium]
MTNKNFTTTCPLPIEDYPNVMLAHGGGGKLMKNLIEKMFIPAFSNDILETQHDSSVVEISGTKIAFTTDSFVVNPLFFPGGDIGSLAVNGTVNDLAMSGAKPLFLSAGFILEEGFPMIELWRIVSSMKAAAEKANVQFITGDTKVVDNGKGDGIFINTAGIGLVETPLEIVPKSVQSGDAILVNGDIGRHGIAIMAQREGLEFESEIESDCAPLNGLVQNLLDENIEIHCLRDLTRGGLASALNEIATSVNRQIEIDESVIPVREDVHGACEILGFDPLYVANEGRMIAFVAPSDAKKALEIMNKHEFGNGSVQIGAVTETRSKLVTMKSTIGATRIVDMLSGEQLPRIC